MSKKKKSRRKLMTAREVADYFGVHLQTVYRGPIRKLARNISFAALRWDAELIQAWCNSPPPRTKRKIVPAQSESAITREATFRPTPAGATTLPMVTLEVNSQPHPAGQVSEEEPAFAKRQELPLAHAAKKAKRKKPGKHARSWNHDKRILCGP